MSHAQERVVPLRVPVPVPVGVPIASVQGTLALDLDAHRDPPAGPPDRTGASGRTVPPAGDVIPIDVHRRRTVEQWAWRYAQAAVEIVGGDRPVSQLLRWSTHEVYDDLARRALLVARAGDHRPGQGRTQPVRPVVVNVRSCFLRPEVAEVSVHLRYGERSRALAARFELRAERWQCSALQFA